jgi:hypothetical protein
LHFLIYSRWGFNTQSYNWIQYDIFSSVPERPSWGASAEASDRGLAFYLNGLISNESSVSTENLGSTTISLEGMVVLDLNNQTVIRLSPSKKAHLDSNTSIGYEQINSYHDRWKP